MHVLESSLAAQWYADKVGSTLGFDSAAGGSALLSNFILRVALVG